MENSTRLKRIWMSVSTEFALLTDVFPPGTRSLFPSGRKDNVAFHLTPEEPARYRGHESIVIRETSR